MRKQYGTNQNKQEDLKRKEVEISKWKNIVEILKINELVKYQIK